MSTTLSAHGGGAQPARIDSSSKVTGGAAMRVYGFSSEAEALTAGFVCEGGPAMSVAIITDAQIASGEWKLDGDPFAVVIYTAPDSLPTEGGFAVPVYPVNGWGSAPAPSEPLFDSAEIGAVNASTLAVTFDQDVSAADYSDGVTIKVNGTATSITSATRQSNHAVVYYVIPVLWHGNDDAVTWEYASGSGSIVAESGSMALGDVTAQGVTNNVSWSMTGGFELQADSLALSDGDPISLWEDQFGNIDFPSSDTGHLRRPIYRVVGGKSRIQFVNDYINGDYSGFIIPGPNSIFDNVNNITMIALFLDDFGASTVFNIQSTVDGFPYGFGMYDGFGYVYTDVDNNLNAWLDPYTGGSVGVQAFRMSNRTDGKFFLNGSSANSQSELVGTLGVYHTNQDANIGCKPGLLSGQSLDGYICAILAYPSAIPDVDIQALSARLAARYGVTP